MSYLFTQPKIIFIFLKYYIFVLFFIISKLFFIVNYFFIFKFFFFIFKKLKKRKQKLEFGFREVKF